ncbi:MAG: MBL fold metallo-hydrolase [Bacillota bacterium]
MIDTGYKKDLDHTLSFIRQTGLDPAAVELIIATHSHCDHIGGNRAIQELSGCGIAMHTIDHHFIESKNDWSTWWRYYGQEADFFAVAHGLEDGDTIRLDELELIVLHTPGHASGQISLYSPQHRFLIAADALWDGDFGVLTTRIEGNSSPFLQQKTLDRLALLDLSVIYPGHGSPLHDPRRAVDRCRKRLESFLWNPERMGRDQIKKSSCTLC